MNGRVSIDGLEVECVIGVYAEERQQPQQILVDVDLDIDFSRASTEDHIGATADYAAIAAMIREIATTRRFRLVESLAEECASAIITGFDADRVSIRIRKPQAIAHARGAGVTVERTRTSKRLSTEHSARTANTETDLTDKVILITGASGGLGQALSHHLAGAGARVVMMSRDAKRLQAAEQGLADAGYSEQAESCLCDVTCTESVRDAVASIHAKTGRIDALVNLAGYGRDFGKIFPARPTGELIASAESVVDCDLLGTLRAVFTVDPIMRQQGEGVIITIGSTPTLDVAPDHLVYQVARAGVRQLAASLAAQHKADSQFNLRVFWLALGNVYTPATYEAFDDDQRKAADLEGWLHPASHLAPIVAALIGGRLSRASGTSLRVDVGTAPSLFAEMGEKYCVFSPT